jgi:putative ABC transport system permease protein
VNPAVQNITAVGLALGFLPVAAVIIIMYRWSMNGREAIFAVIRMLIQLVLIGYLLGYIFASDSAWIVSLILIVMLTIASWIAMRPIGDRYRGLYVRVSISIAIGALPTLVLVTQVVIDVQPWYQPRYLVPLGGMIFASAMNAVSLAAERFEAELNNDIPYGEARKKALQAALIPLINSLLAVGLVSLPGMMTGQILSGVDPLIASRYQIVVMCMIFGSSGIAAACYLIAAGRDRAP